MNTAATPDLLETIVAATRRIIEVRREREPQRTLEARAHQQNPNGAGFRHALNSADRLNIIAECKRRSPSRGVLRRVYDPVAIATEYEAGGAAALSILTEPTFFDGALDHLASVRRAVQLPLLRKDFIVDEYQLLEARANGADAVLLIVSALSERSLKQLREQAHALGLAALVETHDVTEVSRAVDAGADIIGVNNRNLRTLAVDTHASEEAAALIPSHVVAISESGLRTRADLDRMRGWGYRGFLIGERFMTAAQPGTALRQLLNGLGS